MYAKRPKVLIVGAGLAGLTLGMLLDKAGIPFEIYERAQEVKPLGMWHAMFLSLTWFNHWTTANDCILGLPRSYLLSSDTNNPSTP